MEAFWLLSYNGFAVDRIKRIFNTLRQPSILGSGACEVFSLLDLIEIRETF